jgi:putative ABC transport system permease protein
VGSAVGLIGAYGLNRVLVSAMDAAPLAPGLVIGGVAVLWLVGLAATIMPATRASRMEPALATRTV